MCVSLKVFLLEPFSTPLPYSDPLSNSTELNDSVLRELHHCSHCIYYDLLQPLRLRNVKLGLS